MRYAQSQRRLALLLALAIALGALLLTGCRREEPVLQQETTTAATAPSTTETTVPPTTEPPTEPPTTEPPAPVYRNPLNGQILEEPYSGRIFGLTISNTQDVLPHVNASQADIIFECFVNDSVIRMMGLYTDVAQFDRIGPIRSTRLMFNDIAQHYDVVLNHAGGSSQVRNDAKERGIDNVNIDQWIPIQAGCSIRDEERSRQIGYVHSLLAVGPKLVEYAESNGIRTTGDPEKDYLLRFNDDGTPADGEPADSIFLTITHRNHHKATALAYYPDTGRYTYCQYDDIMYDWDSGEPETYRNVVILFTEISFEGRYQTVDFLAGGEGLFACGGKIIPIRWGCDGEDQPLWFTTLDGEPLEFGVGNSYIAITEIGSEVTYSAYEPQETEETEPVQTEE